MATGNERYAIFVSEDLPLSILTGLAGTFTRGICRSDSQSRSRSMNGMLYWTTTIFGEPNRKILRTPEYGYVTNWRLFEDEPSILDVPEYHWGRFRQHYGVGKEMI